jgi:DNA-binding response OmpR family regulator
VSNSSLRSRATPSIRSIDVHIGRLRVAIEDDVKLPRRIITVRGAGYVFAKVHDA